MLISRAHGGGGGVELSDAIPQDVAGVGAAGVGTKASRDDHVHALSSPGTLFEKEYDCPVTVSVRDAVYVVSDTAVDQANASGPAPLSAVGFVASKPLATRARVQFLGSLTGFVGLTANAVYFLSKVSGQITTAIGGYVPGDLLQQMGTALDANTLLLDVDRDYTIL